MKIQIINIDNEKVGEAELNEAIFGLSPRQDILQRVVEWQRAKKRAGTHKTKQIGDVSGTTRKPYKQKGTGNARQGSLRSPQFRGGAVIFGPLVRSHAYDLPKKVRKLGLRIALSTKLEQGKLMIVDDFAIQQGKTSVAVGVCKSLGLSSALIIGGDIVDQNLLNSIKNLNAINVLPSKAANVYDILKHDTLVLTKDAVLLLEERLK